MFFKAKLGCSFYRSMLVILTCLSISSQPLEYKGVKNSHRNCSSTMTTAVLGNFTNRNCSGSQTNATTNGMTNGTEKESQPTWYFLSEENYRNIVIATMSVAATGALLNFVVIIAMTIDPLKILRKGPWVTILNLAIADLISCISVFLLWGQPFFIQESDLYYDTTYFGWGFGSSASFLWLTFLAVQIFAITKFPLKSRYWFTTLKIVLVGIAVWLFAFLLGLSYITHVFYLPLTMNLKIWTAQIGVLQIALVVQIVLNIKVAFEIIRSGRSSGNPQNAKHKNIAKTVMILTLILFLTAFPYFVLKQLEFLVRLGYFDQGKTTEVLYYLSYCYAPIAVLNFAANPILYALRLPDYRETLFAFVGKTRSRSRRRLTQNRSSQLTNTFYMKSQRQTASTMSEKSERHSDLKKLPISSQH